MNRQEAGMLFQLIKNCDHQAKAHGGIREFLEAILRNAIEW